MKTRLILHASRLYTGQKIREKNGRKLTADDQVYIEDGALLMDVVKNIILETGPSDQFLDLKSKHLDPDQVEIIDLKNQYALLPGWIDCHTHLVFAGNRAEEFALRSSGVTYEEIAKKGGGIQTTVRSTRAASEDELFELAIPRLQEAYRYGTRTIEIKSGYGLTVEDELKQLRVIKRLQDHFKAMTLVPTLCAAHAVPQEMSADAWIAVIVKDLLNKVKNQNLTDACDVFVDPGYFTLEQAEVLFQQAQSLGLKIKIHADELACTRATGLGVRYGALSCDHLLKIHTDDQIAISQSSTVAVLLPSTALTLNTPQAPARELINLGAQVALATDFNPGTSMTLNLAFILSLGAMNLKMSSVELLAAVTYNAACALGLEKQKGSLLKGLDADYVILPYATFEESYYHLATSSFSEKLLEL